MKNFVGSTKFKLSLLCLGMVVIGVGMGLLINNSKTIPALKDGQEVIAQIDGKKFTANDLYDELKSKGGESVLIDLIDKYIIDKEIKDMTDSDTYATSYVANLKTQYETYGEDFEAAMKNAGYNTEEEFKAFVSLSKAKQTVAENYIKANYFTEKEIETYYNDNIEGDMNVRYILIKPEEVDSTDADYTTKTEANEKAALAEAKEVIEKLNDGKEFATLAKKYSDDSTTASEGGLFSGFSKSDVVSEFWTASTKLEDGKYTSEPVKSSYGYFVILRINQDKKPSLKDAKEEVLTALLTELQTKDSDVTTTAWVDVRKSYNLNIADSDIEKAYKKTISSYE